MAKKKRRALNRDVAAMTFGVLVLYDIERCASISAAADSESGPAAATGNGVPASIRS